MYLHIEFFSVWSLSEVLKIEQDKGSRSNLRNRARWPVIECFKAVTMLPCPFFKSIRCLINLLMTFFFCLLYLLIATISSIYLTLYFLQTLSCQVFNPFCGLSLVIGFGFGFVLFFSMHYWGSIYYWSTSLISQLGSSPSNISILFLFVS